MTRSSLFSIKANSEDSIRLKGNGYFAKQTFFPLVRLIFIHVKYGEVDYVLSIFSPNIIYPVVFTTLSLRGFNVPTERIHLRSNLKRPNIDTKTDPGEFY